MADTAKNTLELLQEPIALPVDVRLAGGPKGEAGAVLFLGREDQPLALEIVNRSHRDIKLGAADLKKGEYHVRLALRPHTLLNAKAARLDEASVADGWKMVHDDPAAAGHRQIFRFANAKKITIPAGAMVAIRLTGLEPDPFGGARATQTSVNYAAMKFGDAKTKLASHLLVRLALLAAEGAEARIAHDLRTGTSVSTDMFSASFVDSSTIINDRSTLNKMWIRIINISGQHLQMMAGQDNGPKFKLEYDRTGPFGLLGGDGSIAITNTDEAHGRRWEVVNGASELQPKRDHAWWPGMELMFEVDVRSHADAGVKPLRLRYENMPPDGLGAGTLILLPTLSLVAPGSHATTVTSRFSLWGTDSSIELHTGELNISGALGGEIKVSHSTKTLGRLEIRAGTPHGMKFTGPRVDVEGPLTVSGHLRADSTFSAKTATVDGKLTAEDLEATDEIMAKTVYASQELKVVGRAQMHGKVLLFSPDDLSNSRMHVDATKEAVTFQTRKRRGERKEPPLLLNPSGGQVGINTKDTKNIPAALVVEGTIRARAIHLWDPGSQRLWTLEASNGSLTLSDHRGNTRIGMDGAWGGTTLIPNLV